MHAERLDLLRRLLCLSKILIYDIYDAAICALLRKAKCDRLADTARRQ
jgi:hypothetical protein